MNKRKHKDSGADFNTIVITRHSNYREEIRKAYHYGTHIAALVENRSKLIEQIKVKFNKTQENIEFELSKLRKD